MPPGLGLSLALPARAVHGVAGAPKFDTGDLTNDSNRNYGNGLTPQIIHMPVIPEEYRANDMTYKDVAGGRVYILQRDMTLVLFCQLSFDRGRASATTTTVSLRFDNSDPTSATDEGDPDPDFGARSAGREGTVEFSGRKALAAGARIWIVTDVRRRVTNRWVRFREE